MDENDDMYNTIKKLQEDSIRRIVAEQAITDISSIVKELVDNSIDADGNTIKIRLFGQGLEIIEVSDDGQGVPMHSRKNLATRYATSKIKSFEDIYSGTGLTMGFRGEALFSMACLSSQLIVASRTESEDVAQKMIFQRDGRLDESSVTNVHRTVGTTVAVLKPFAHLPARRADMSRRIRTERSKLFRLIESYAIFNVGVGIKLIDIVSGREDVALATSSTSTTLQENVSAVMGHKFLSTLSPIDVKLGSVITSRKEDNVHDWGIKGLLSQNPQADASARSINCFSINGRVVQLPKLAALLRKVWTGFGGKKKPSCILSITLPNCSFDINLSPDKQQVLLLYEKEILDLLRQGLTEFYSTRVNGIFRAKQLETHEGPADVIKRERQKHKRRFAFVHDLSKAKMQHDLEDRERAAPTKLRVQERGQRAHFEANKIASTSLENHSKDSSKNKEHYECSKLDKLATGSDEGVRMSNESGKIWQRKENTNQTPTHEIPLVNDNKRQEKEHQVHSQIGKMTSDSVEKEVNDHEETCDKDGQRQERQEQALTSAMAAVGKHLKYNKERREQNGEQSKSLVSSTDTMNRKRKVQSDDDIAHRSRCGKNLNAEFDRNLSKKSRSKSDLTDFERQKWTEIQSKFREDPSREKFKGIATRSSMMSTMLMPLNSSLDDSSPNDTKNQLYQEVTDKVESFSAIALVQERRSPSADLSREKVLPGNAGVPKTREHQGVYNKDEIPLDQVLTTERPSIPPSRKLEHGAISVTQTKGNTHSGIVSIENANERARAGSDSLLDLSWTSFKETNKICFTALQERLRLQGRRNRAIQFSRETGEEARRKTDENQITNRGISQSLESGVLSLSKAKFLNGMKVLGQFNLGFILCLCDENNLWIFDQHACDEQYNFEKLRRDTKLHEQKLLKPMSLDLTSLEEMCILDHMDIFEANGFRFEFRPNAPIHQRLLLTALPHSGAQDGRKAVQFGEDDVKALCSMLSEGSSYDAGDGGTGTDGSGKSGNNAVRRHASMASSKPVSASSLVARLPRAIAMFASRACRTSIMIGTALSHVEMEKVVSRLAEVEFPWNCPHGRPTVRHVGSVSTVALADEDRAIEHIIGPAATAGFISRGDGA